MTQSQVKVWGRLDTKEVEKKVGVRVNGVEAVSVLGRQVVDYAAVVLG